MHLAVQPGHAPMLHIPAQLLFVCANKVGQRLDGSGPVEDIERNLGRAGSQHVKIRPIRGEKYPYGQWKRHPISFGNADMASRNRYREGMIGRARFNERAGGQISGIFNFPTLAETYRVAALDILGVCPTLPS